MSRSSIVLAAPLVCLACTTGARSSDLGPAREASLGPGRLVPAETQRREPDLEHARFFARIPGLSSEQDLELSSVQLTVEAGAATARSRLEVLVRNPAANDVEAVLRIPIPPGAAITGAMLYIDDRPTRGSLIDRPQAKEIYDEIVLSRRDPLLVVWNGPEWIDVTIFPVPGESRRKFELEWVEPLGAEGDAFVYRVPVLAHQGTVVGMPETATIGQETVDLAGRRWVSLAGGRERTVAGRSAGDPFGYVMVPGGAKRFTPRHAVVVAETSAAMSRDDRLRQREQLTAILEGVPRGTRVTLLAADWLTEPLVEQATAGEALAALDRLDSIPSAGALDLERALAEAVDRSDVSDAVVYVGPGADGFGGDAVDAPLARMRARKVSLLVVGAGDVAQSLSGASWRSGGRVVSSARPEFGELFRNIGSPPPAAVDPVEKWFPLETVTGELVWLGRMTGQTPAGADKGAARDLSALWARSRSVTSQDREEEIPPEQRVLTPYTSLLVLEPEFSRFGMERSSVEIEQHTFESPVAAPGEPRPVSAEAARARSQAAGAGMLGVLREQDGSPLSTLAAGEFRSVPAADTQSGFVQGDLGNIQAGWGLGVSHGPSSSGGTGWGTIGMGRYGTLGHGAGTGAGYGHGFGVGRGGVRAREPEKPSVRIGTVTVDGSLDVAVVRRVLRRNLARVEYCYQKELLVDPSLDGTLTVDLVIGPDGRVISVETRGMPDSGVDACVEGLVGAIQFPTFDSGVVTAACPFTFKYGVESRWDRALAASSVADMVSALEAPATDQPDVLAWWIVDSLHLLVEPPAAYVLAARLLAEAGAERDARRVLAEGAAHYAKPIARAMRTLGHDADADRVAALAARR